jgi:hypothetical protein
MALRNILQRRAVVVAFETGSAGYVANDGVDDARSGIGVPYGDRLRVNHLKGGRPHAD